MRYAHDSCRGGTSGFGRYVGFCRPAPGRRPGLRHAAPRSMSALLCSGSGGNSPRAAPIPPARIERAAILEKCALHQNLKVLTCSANQFEERYGRVRLLPLTTKRQGP